ncbi:MAG TPA: hypothetical protein VIV11_22585 [Kofleriaceae bacterium]
MKKLMLLVVAAACSKSGSAPAPAAKLDVSGVNALVPAELKDKLAFEQRDIIEERGKRSKTTYTLAAPKGWEQDMKSFASVKPPSEPDLGFMTSFKVGSNCDGVCESKDWAKVSEKASFAQFRGEGWKIVKDESNKTSHLMVAQMDDSVYVTYAWWADGARKYYTCSAHLEKEVAAAADAFAKACQAVTVKGDA